jgi:hypothetical protein
MNIETRIFDLASDKYHNLSSLAKAMELSVSQVYRVRDGKRGINEKFIIGAKKAFPERRLDELFFITVGRPSRFASGQMTAASPPEAASR